MKNEAAKQAACTEKMQIVHVDDLPLSCPTKNMQLWHGHPKVYLPIDQTGHAKCPYCGSLYILQYD